MWHTPGNCKGAATALSHSLSCHKRIPHPNPGAHRCTMGGSWLCRNIRPFAAPSACGGSAPQSGLGGHEAAQASRQADKQGGREGPRADKPHQRQPPMPGELCSDSWRCAGRLQQGKQRAVAAVLCKAGRRSWRQAESERERVCSSASAGCGRAATQPVAAAAQPSRLSRSPVTMAGGDEHTPIMFTMLPCRRRSNKLASCAWGGCRCRRRLLGCSPTTSIQPGSIESS